MCLWVLKTLWVSMYKICKLRSYIFMYRTCCCLVTNSCLTLCNPMNCSPPGSSVYGISQVRILEWVAISFSRGSSWPRDWTHMSCIGRWILYHWAMREAQKCDKHCLFPVGLYFPASITVVWGFVILFNRIWTKISSFLLGLAFKKSESPRRWWSQ